MEGAEGRKKQPTGAFAIFTVSKGEIRKTNPCISRQTVYAVFHTCSPPLLQTQEDAFSHFFFGPSSATITVVFRILFFFSLL